jgi:Tol biopolymer transport system component
MATRRGLILAAVVSALGVASAVAGARPAAVRPGLIAFTRADGLYAMRADGSGVRRIMRTGPEALYGGGAAWSPDGRRLAFAAWNGVWLLDANGRNRVRLVAAGVPPYWIGVKPHRTLFAPRPTNFGSPTWSPDGRRIAFTAFQGAENRDVWIVDADGSGLHRLVKTPLFEGEVDWSPAGGRLVFDSGSWVSDVYVARTDGGGLRNLTPGGGWVGSGQPAWSPDGRRIAFGRPSGLWVTDADGGSPAQLTSRKGADGFPDWSPDGGRGAFVRKLDPKRESSAEIYVVDADGGGVTRLTHNRIGEGSPAWQPVAAP